MLRDQDGRLRAYLTMGAGITHPGLGGSRPAGIPRGPRSRDLNSTFRSAAQATSRAHSVLVSGNEQLNSGCQPMEPNFKQDLPSLAGLSAIHVTIFTHSRRRWRDSQRSSHHFCTDFSNRLVEAIDVCSLLFPPPAGMA
jgi:hypothetical protein